METTTYGNTTAIRERREKGDRFIELLERLESIADQLDSAVSRVELAEDRLDRARRPFGDGRR